MENLGCSDPPKCVNYALGAVITFFFFFFALSLSKVVITLRGFCKTQDFMFFEAEQMQCFETIFVL